MPTPTIVQPYLFFNGSCEEAADFYVKAIGAEITMKMRFRESPDQSCNPPDSAEKIMHMSMKIGGCDVMASDGRCTGKANFDGFCLSINFPDAAQCEQAFNALAEGGKVEMPLSPVFWSPMFGMVEDKFGIGWMISIPAAQA